MRFAAQIAIADRVEGARKATLEGNELCLEFSPDARHLRDTLAKSDNVKILREVGKDVTGRDLGRPS